MKQQKLDEILRKHKLYMERSEGGERAYLIHADLSGANLSGADLRHADLDYSCFPLWCGGTDFTCDERLVLQLLAHVSTLHFETENIELLKALKLVRKVSRFSHRASDLGLKR